MNEKAELQIDAEQVREAWRKSLKKSRCENYSGWLALVNNLVNHYTIIGLALVVARAKQTG